MRYSSNAPAIAYAAPGTKLSVLGAVLLLIAGCLLGIGHLIIELFSPIATEPSGVLTVHENYVAVAIALGAIGGIAVIVGIAINSKLPASKKLRARVRAGIFDPRFGNPLHLRDGEVVPRVVCKETEAGRFEISISTLSSTVDEVAKLAECISARLCGRFSRYAVVLTEADVASNHVTFFVQDVTLHHEIEASSVEEMSPPSAYELRVQDGTNIDLRTSGSMLVAGKTRSGKTTGVIALLIQALLSGPDEYGSQVLIIDPKQAELSRLPHVVSLGPDGDAHAILEALTLFAESIKKRQSVLNDRSAETGDAVHWWDAGFHVSVLFLDEYVALRTMFPKRASKEDPDYCLATFDGLVKRIVTMGASAGCYAIISIAEASVEEGGLPSMVRSACSTRTLFRPTLPEARLIWDADRLADLAAPRTYGPGDAWFSSTDGVHHRIVPFFEISPRHAPWGACYPKAHLGARSRKQAKSLVFEKGSGTMSGSSPIKTRAMMYEQQLSHLPASVDDMYGKIAALSPKRYAGIVHDCDQTDAGRPTAAHLHVMMEFANPRSVRSIAKALGDKPERIEAWKAGVENGFSYLCHKTDGARSKHQYDPGLVCANFDYPALLASIESRVTRARSHSNIKILLDDLLEGRIDKEALVSQLSGSEYARAKRQVEDVYARRLQAQAVEWRAKMVEEGRRVQTVWIFGPAGTGKSTLAEQYARRKGGRCFVSGSTRDIFQGYAGEHSVILDELRPKSIPYADLLRLTDPFAIGHEVMAPSRYSDKPVAADLIVITSPYSPYEFFYEQGNNADTDGFDQLERRLAAVIEMQQREICLCQYAGNGWYLPMPDYTRPNPYSRFARGDDSSADPTKVYESVLGTSADSSD